MSDYVEIKYDAKRETLVDSLGGSPVDYRQMTAETAKYVLVFLFGRKKVRGTYQTVTYADGLSVIVNRLPYEEEFMGTRAEM